MDLEREPRRQPTSKKHCKMNPTSKHSFTTFEKVEGRVGSMRCSWCGKKR